MYTKKFWMDVTERSIKSFGQALFTSGILSASGLKMTPGEVLVACLSMAGASVVSSLMSALRGDPNSASLVK